MTIPLKIPLPLPLATLFLGDSDAMTELLDSFVEAAVPEAVGDVFAEAEGAVR